MWGSLVAVHLFSWIGVICGKGICEDERPFPCWSGRCIPMEWLCDGAYDCRGDRSDESLCGPVCPKYSFECTRGSECYNYSKHCDGRLDCSDASDETNCDDVNCGIGRVRCAFGGCAVTRDLCCPIRNGGCVQENINVSTHIEETRLIFTNGRALYSLSLANNSRQLLHQDDKFSITALAYSAKEHMVFWAAGPKIWSTSLIWGGKYKKSLGDLQFDCVVRILEFDWISQDFYLVCEHSTRITVCKSHAANNSMPCSPLIAIDLWKITWLGLNPNAGRMFVGGPGRNDFEIFEAEIDGSSRRRIYQGNGSVPECNLNIKKNEISLLHLDGHGKLSTLNLTSGTLNQTGSYFLRSYTTARALASDVAILNDNQGFFALFFWHNGAVSTQKSIEMTATVEVSLVVDPEAQPSDSGCESGLERCPIEGCAQTRDLCRPVRNGSCVQQNVNVSTDIRTTRLIFANGPDLYSLSLANNNRQLLHRDEKYNVTALAYGAKEDAVFWAAGPRIWSTLLWEGKQKKSLGDLHFDCAVQIMVFDWITQNFFLVCEHSTLITVCRSHAANNSMLCSHLMAIDLWKITWLGLNPNAGRMFVGGPTTENFKIFEAEIDGGSQRRIYQGERSIPECNLNIEKNEISLLHLDKNGNLSTLNLTSGTLNRTGSRFIRFNTTAKALAGDVAILQDIKGSFALLFWNNGTVFTQKSIDMIATSEVSLVIEPDAQPPGENTCKDFGCDHICLLASSGPFCKCDFAYELMDDEHSCKLPATRVKSPKNEGSGIASEILPASFPAENTHHMETRDEFRIHIFYVTAIILIVTCAAAIYLRSRNKLCGSQSTNGMMSASVSFAATRNTSTAKIGSFSSTEDDPFIELET